MLLILVFTFTELFTASAAAYTDSYHRCTNWYVVKNTVPRLYKYTCVLWLQNLYEIYGDATYSENIMCCLHRHRYIIYLQLGGGGTRHDFMRVKICRPSLLFIKPYPPLATIYCKSSWASCFSVVVVKNQTVSQVEHTLYLQYWFMKFHDMTQESLPQNSAPLCSPNTLA